MATPPRSPILEVLAEDGPATGPELAARLEMHPETVERYCKELQRRNRIRQGTGGLYTLAERERERVRERRASD